MKKSSTFKSKFRFLITGACGFIGSHLTTELIERGHTVIGVDNLSTGNLRNRHPQMRFVQWDVRVPLWHWIVEKPDIPEDTSEFAPTPHYVDGIFHLADIVGVATVERNQMVPLSHNAIATRNTIRVARDWQCPILFTSSSEVYGSSGTFSEEDICEVSSLNMTGRKAYALGKLFSEALLNCSNIHHASTRLFNVIGPNQRWSGGHAVPGFFYRLIRGQEPLVHKPGIQLRSWMDVRDCVDTLINLMFRLLSFKEPIGPINVGSHSSYPVKEVARLCSEASAGKDPLLIEPPSYRESDPDMRLPVLSKLEKLNCHIKYPFPLEETLSWIWKEVVAHDYLNDESS